MGVSTEIRHKYILDSLNENGKVLVSELAEKLNVTEVTIRRDLTFLNKNGLLKKTYGGAVKITPDLAFSVHFRQKKKASAKKIIGKLAATLINNDDIIYLEAGSTCYEIIPFLADKKNLTVIVNPKKVTVLLIQHQVFFTDSL